MTELICGKNIVEIIKNSNSDIIGDFEATHKPVELTDEGKMSSIETVIKKGEIKDYIRI